MNPNQFERDENDPRPFPGPRGGRQDNPYKFTAEELRVLRECNKESFFQRCLPLSALLGGGTYYGCKTGIISTSTRFGAVPSVLVAITVGYFAGKLSYRAKCAEKLMMLPNSPIGEMLRQKRKGGFQETLEPGFGPGMSLAPFSGMSASDTYTDIAPRNSLDLDTTRPELGGLDDSHRPSVDNPIYEEEMPPVQPHSTTYEELRRKNREEYQQRRVGTYTESPQPKQEAPPPSTSLPKGHTNKYGDAWG